MLETEIEVSGISCPLTNRVCLILYLFREYSLSSFSIIAFRMKHVNSFISALY